MLYCFSPFNFSDTPRAVLLLLLAWIFVRQSLQCHSPVGYDFSFRHDKWATLVQPSQQITLPPSWQIKQYSSHSRWVSSPDYSSLTSEMELSSFSESMTFLLPTGFLACFALAWRFPCLARFSDWWSLSSAWADSSSLSLSDSEDSKYFTKSPRCWTLYHLDKVGF